MRGPLRVALLEVRVGGFLEGQGYVFWVRDAARILGDLGACCGAAGPLSWVSVLKSAGGSSASIE